MGISCPQSKAPTAVLLTCSGMNVCLGAHGSVLCVSQGCQPACFCQRQAPEQPAAILTTIKRGPVSEPQPRLPLGSSPAHLESLNWKYKHLMPMFTDSYCCLGSHSLFNRRDVMYAAAWLIICPAAQLQGLGAASVLRWTSSLSSDVSALEHVYCVHCGHIVKLMM